MFTSKKVSLFFNLFHLHIWFVVIHNAKHIYNLLFICFLGLLLPVVHQSRRSRDQLSLGRHCSHLRLRLEPSKRPAGTSQGSQDRTEETGTTT